MSSIEGLSWDEKIEGLIWYASAAKR